MLSLRSVPLLQVMVCMFTGDHFVEVVIYGFSDPSIRTEKAMWKFHQVLWPYTVISKAIIREKCPIQSGYYIITLQWRHKERDGVLYHRCLECLPKRLFRRRSKKPSKLRITGLCEGNSTVTGEFPSQRASNAENVSIWWRHRGNKDPRRMLGDATKAKAFIRKQTSHVHPCIIRYSVWRQVTAVETII